MAENFRQDLGSITPYAVAVDNGYEGTEAEYNQAITDLGNIQAEATTLPVGSPATASYEDGVISFGIPTPQYDDSELQNDMAVLEARMDTFSSLTDGSTTGDAELIDIRVGADGVTYSNAGTAVRTQISNLKNDLDVLNPTVNGVISTNYTEGKNLYAYGVNHSIIDDPDACLSDLIPLTWVWDSTTRNVFWYSDGIDDSNSYYIFFYDTNKEFLGFRGKDGSKNRSVYGYDNSAYVQFSFKKGFTGKITATDLISTYWEANAILVSAGLVQKVGDLEELNTEEKTNLVSAINEIKNDIPSSIEPKDTSFFYVSKNMIDPSSCVVGEYVNQVTGAFVTNPSYNRTDYIEVSPETTYVIRELDGAFGNNCRYVFYDSAKVYISGNVGGLSEMLITTPSNASYMAVSNGTAFDNWMIAKYENGDKSFESFNTTHVLPKYIQKDADGVIINLPEKIYALVGYETNIYFENITEKWEKYEWDVSCTVGKQLARGYRITPTSDDVGSYTLTIKVKISENNYKEITTTLIVTSTSAGNGETASVIILGDSTTYNGIAVDKLHNNFTSDVMGVQTIGTMGTSPNNHEGRSGWKWSDYFTKASITYPEGDSRGTIYNPFYNPSTQTFDASYYFANSGVAKPDYFIINMGINDVFGYISDSELETAMPTILGRCEAAVQSVLNATTTTKVGVCLTIPPNHSQDAFGKAYGCAQTRDRCKRNNTLWVNALIEQFANRESERIYIIPINACLDTIYNMGMQTLPVNARNTEMTYESPVANGGVHPVESGYWQIADVYTAFIKANS